MCDVPFHDNSPPLDFLKDQIEDFSESNNTPLKANDHLEIVLNSNDGISSSDDDSLHEENIDYVEASPPDSELVNSEVMEIVIPEVGGIDDDIILTIKDDILRKKLLNVNLLITKIEAFNDNPTSEISSGSTTTHSDISLSKYDSFIFELAHIISPPEYDRFYFWNLPDPGELMSVLNSRIRENLSSTTSVNLPIEDDHSPFLAYVVWIFLAYLTYPVIPPYQLRMITLLFWHMLYGSFSLISRIPLYGSFSLISRIPLFLLIFWHT
nr:hypothetical protein [Tanacetum cinerariifolium]